MTGNPSGMLGRKPNQDSVGVLNAGSARFDENCSSSNKPACLCERKPASSTAPATRNPPASRLPAQRQLAEEMGINVSTVSRSYRELQLSGLVIGSKRRGSIVTDGAMPHIAATRPSHSNGIDLTLNRPATQDFLDQLALTMATLSDDPRFIELQEYQPLQGTLWARVAGAK